MSTRVNFCVAVVRLEDRAQADPEILPKVLWCLFGVVLLLGLGCAICGALTHSEVTRLLRDASVAARALRCRADRVPNRASDQPAKQTPAQRGGFCCSLPAFIIVASS